MDQTINAQLFTMHIYVHNYISVLHIRLYEHRYLGCFAPIVIQLYGYIFDALFMYLVLRVCIYVFIDFLYIYIFMY